MELCNLSPDSVKPDECFKHYNLKKLGRVIFMSWSKVKEEELVEEEINENIHYQERSTPLTSVEQLIASY